MLATIRTTTGRENTVLESIITRVKNKQIPVKSAFYPEEIRGYIFIEGKSGDIEEAIRNIPHVRGALNKKVKLKELERFLIPEKTEIKLEVGDIVEIISGPFKGEQAKVTRIDEGKKEMTGELLEAAIPIPVTIPVTAVRMYEKGKVDGE
jgi:transcriptional antiterminator NusG